MLADLFQSYKLKLVLWEKTEEDPIFSPLEGSGEQLLQYKWVEFRNFYDF